MPFVAHEHSVFSHICHGGSAATIDASLSLVRGSKQKTKIRTVMYLRNVIRPTVHMLHYHRVLIDRVAAIRVQDVRI